MLVIPVVEAAQTLFNPGMLRDCCCVQQLPMELFDWWIKWSD
jgi:hypothetical protein